VATSYDAARESETCLDQTVTQEPPSRQSLCHTKISLASSSPPKLSTFQQYPCVACPQLWLYLHQPLTATCASQSHFRHCNTISSSLGLYLVFAVPAFSEPSKHYNCTWPRPSSACASCPRPPPSFLPQTFFACFYDCSVKDTGRIVCRSQCNCYRRRPSSDPSEEKASEDPNPEARPAHPCGLFVVSTMGPLSQL
jgi:hypothetical protein